MEEKEIEDEEKMRRKDKMEHNKEKMKKKEKMNIDLEQQLKNNKTPNEQSVYKYNFNCVQLYCL